ncbi:hypothetical protein D3C86_1314000 [compost metagenome]
MKRSVPFEPMSGTLLPVTPVPSRVKGRATAFLLHPLELTRSRAVLGVAVPWLVSTSLTPVKPAAEAGPEPQL